MQTKSIVIQSVGLGGGDDTLGSMLMANFLRLLAESKEKPKALIFWNTGVMLVCEGSPVLEHVKKLEETGIEILVCTTCLEYFDLMEKLAVGKLTTMMKSIDAMFEGEFITL
jgi:selenium metabolism protein YedF